MQRKHTIAAQSQEGRISASSIILLKISLSTARRVDSPAVHLSLAFKDRRRLDYGGRADSPTARLTFPHLHSTT